MFAINSAPSRTPPKASFAATPAEIAGAADKIQPNKCIQYRLPHSGVKMLPAVRKKKVTVHTGVILQFFPPLLKKSALDEYRLDQNTDMKQGQAESLHEHGTVYTPTH